MRITDFTDDYEALTYDDLERILGIRDPNGFNEFHLTHHNQEYPDLTILVSDDIACLHYFLYSGHAGFQSVGHLYEKEYSITFLISDSGDVAEITNSAAVSFSVAIMAAMEFMILEKQPTSLEWFEL